ncbi:MAG TPA: NADP-dependent oxidoreductase [Lactobacillus sp.]|nr:NADP-dependent oxidoreductase [Lactobacillus sp.]
MKAFGFNQYGDENVMEELEMPMPTISSNEVLVKNEAFAINAFDVAVRSGRFKNSVTLLFPTILGTDAVGRITAVGNSVSDYHIGDEIIAHAGTGTYAEYFKVSSANIGLRPAEYDRNEAAGLPLSGITAYNVLVHVAQVRPGQTIAVLGAAGGVGSMIVQMAKALGLYVIGTDTSVVEKTVLALGANEFGAYDTEHVGQKFNSVADIVVDATNGGTGAKAGVPIVKPNGIYVSLTTLPTDTSEKPDASYRQMIPRRDYLDSDAFAAISLMIRNNQLHVAVGKMEAFTLAGIRNGQHLVANGNPDGKVIVTL